MVRKNEHKVHLNPIRVKPVEIQSKEQVNRKILIVEDDLDLKPLIISALRSIDPLMDMTWEVDAESASKRIAEYASEFSPKPYDLIVADVFLKGDHNGLDLLILLHEHYEPIPFMVISSADESEVVPVIRQYSSNAIFMKKPLEYQQFQRLAIQMMDIDANDLF